MLGIIIIIIMINHNNKRSNRKSHSREWIVCSVSCADSCHTLSLTNHSWYPEHYITHRNLRDLAWKHGHRVVPTMLDKNGMQERLMSFRTFVQDFLVPSSKDRTCWTLGDATTTTTAAVPARDTEALSSSSSRVAYLAQHVLLDQIPELMNDIDQTPQLLSGTDIVQRNVWMGTGGTRTPLHFDTYDNLFVQVLGAKYVRLYDRGQTEKLYVERGGDTNGKAKSYAKQGNMSAVDCEQEDYDLHPLAREAAYQEVLLLPGDCLFIPAGMWHYIRSLSTSVSVNFWW